MKKWLLIIWSTILLVSTFSFSENIIGNPSNSTIQLKTSVSIPDQWMLQYINLGFCDEEVKNITKQSRITIRPWETKEICVIFTNTSSSNINISSSFVDAEKNNDNKLICSMWANTWASLVSHISYNPKLYTFTLHPKENIIKKAKISIPKNMTGILNGCIWYQLNIKKDDNYTGLFFVVRRKVGIIEVNITWNIYNFGLRDDIKYIYRDNQMDILHIIAGFLFILFIYYISIIIRWNIKNKK